MTCILLRRSNDFVVGWKGNLLRRRSLNMHVHKSKLSAATSGTDPCRCDCLCSRCRPALPSAAPCQVRAGSIAGSHSAARADACRPSTCQSMPCKNTSSGKNTTARDSRELDREPGAAHQQPPHCPVLVTGWLCVMWLK